MEIKNEQDLNKWITTEQIANANDARPRFCEWCGGGLQFRGGVLRGFDVFTGKLKTIDLVFQCSVNPQHQSWLLRGPNAFEGHNKIAEKITGYYYGGQTVKGWDIYSGLEERPSDSELFNDIARAQSGQTESPS